jgi:hypothetical protein
MPAICQNTAKLQDMRPAEALERLVLDKRVDHRLRFRAIRTLSQIGDSRSEGALLKALEDEYPIVRHEAISALRKIGASNARVTLEKLLDCQSPYLRRKAAKDSDRDIWGPRSGCRQPGVFIQASEFGGRTDREGNPTDGERCPGIFSWQAV